MSTSYDTNSREAVARKNFWAYAVIAYIQAKPCVCQCTGPDKLWVLTIVYNNQMAPSNSPTPNDTVHMTMSMPQYITVSSSINSSWLRVIIQSSPSYVHVSYKDLTTKQMITCLHVYRTQHMAQWIKRVHTQHTTISALELNSQHMYDNIINAYDIDPAARIYSI